MFPSFRRPSLIARLAAFAAVLAPGIALSPQASAQSTAPQLLPYMTRLTAGSGTTPHYANTAAGVGAATPTIYTCTDQSGAVTGFPYDAWGAGCLGQDQYTLNAKSAIVDATGAIYFTDYTTAALSGTTTPTGSLAKATGVVKRLDPITGLVTTIAGSGIKNPTSGSTNCSAGAVGDLNNAPKTGTVFGDGCLATSVVLEEPTGLALSPDGKTLYVVDEYAYNIRAVNLASGGIAGVALTNNGSGYATAPTVTFSAPQTAGGVTATGTAIIATTGSYAGEVIAVTITNAGTGYTSAPTVTFSIPGTGTNAAAGQGVVAGVISTLVGSDAGTSASADGFSATGGCNIAATSTGTSPCYFYGIYSVAVDSNGIIYTADEYLDALLAINNGTTTQTVLGVSVPPGTMQIVGGYKSGGCVDKTGSSGGCSYNTPYVPGSQATSSGGILGGPYTLVLDSYSNLYFTDQYYANIAQVSAGTNLANGSTPGYLNSSTSGGVLANSVPATGVIDSYAGSFPLAHSATTETNSKRGIAGTFGIGYGDGVGIEASNNSYEPVNNNNNLYIVDYSNALVWRVDGATQTMYAIAGGNAAYTLGATCTNLPSNVAATATTTVGDGCPGKSAKISTTLFAPNPDNSGNVYLADTYALGTNNGEYRELATGANFGLTGAIATDYLDVHFQAGDGPATTAPYTITTNAAVFVIGTPVCTTNADSNANFGNSTDCILPVTASPTTSGTYSGQLTVVSKNGTTVNFPLTGYFAQSPVTRTTVTYSASIGGTCSGTTYASTASFTLTAKLTANGPSAPTGTVQFYDNNVAIGTPQTVVNLGTTSAPVYGAIYTTTIAATGSQSITATFIPTPSTTSPVFTEYYLTSTSPAATFTTATPSYTATPLTSNYSSSVTAGGTALYSFTLATTVYTGTVSFSCTGLPAGSSCAFSPATIVATGCSASSTVAVSVYTTAPTVSSPAGFGGTRGPWSMVGLFAGLILATSVGLFRRRLPIRAGQMLMAVALLLGASGMVACSKSAGTVLAPGTPAGSYTVTVNLAGSDGTTSSFTIPLTVK